MLDDKNRRASDAFSEEGYRALLKAMMDSGYRVVGYEDADPDRRDLILRHDIDFSPEAALPIARIEAELGVMSHYYVLIDTPFYNSFSAPTIAILQEILGLGHRLGLHFDASPYGEQWDALDEGARRDCGLLEAALGCSTDTISFHRPVSTLLNLDRPLADRLHTYMPQFFSAMAYVSDSGGEFRFGHPLDDLAIANGSAMQLLTHPIWWTGDGDEPRMAKLDRLLDGRAAALRDAAVANCRPYADWIKATP